MSLLTRAEGASEGGVVELREGELRVERRASEREREPSSLLRRCRAHVLMSLNAICLCRRPVVRSQCGQNTSTRGVSAHTCASAYICDRGSNERPGRRREMGSRVQGINERQGVLQLYTCHGCMYAWMGGGHRDQVYLS